VAGYGPVMRPNANRRLVMAALDAGAVR
jgi:hypothetical protein